MSRTNHRQQAAAFPDAVASHAGGADTPRPAPSRSLVAAADAVTARLRALSERPTALAVRDLIERYMAVYAGRDVALVRRLQTWQVILGDFTLETVDDDVIHAALAEIAALPRSRSRAETMKAGPSSRRRVDSAPRAPGRSTDVTQR